jgi:hypothetical protein
MTELWYMKFILPSTVTASNVIASTVIVNTVIRFGELTFGISHIRFISLIEHRLKICDRS